MPKPTSSAIEEFLENKLMHRLQNQAEAPAEL
jgi:hypothetical protein